MSWRTLEYQDGKVTFIDQTSLPGEVKYLTTSDYRVIAEAIKKLRVRGAPAIGIAAAFGVVLGALEYQGSTDLPEQIEKIIAELGGTRPTAVNLFWALNRQRKILESKGDRPKKELIAALEKEELPIAAADEHINR